MAERRRSSWRRLLLTLGALVALAVLVALAGLGYLVMAYPNQAGPGGGRVVELSLPPGASLLDATTQLSAARALREPRTFGWYAQLLGAGARLRQGTVLVYDSMSPRELLQRIAQGYGSAELRVVIPEGFSRFDIAKRLARWGVCPEAAFLRATEEQVLLTELGIEADTAEGYLFPDTYRLIGELAPDAVVRRLVANARKRTAAVLTAHAAAVAQLKGELGFDQRQLLTLASIVEKEAHVPDERAVIAGVFLNRLRDPAWKPRRLQADPTVAYGCFAQPALPACHGFDGKRITRAMLADTQNTYNTYRHDGLPPGPIANPGLSALLAVLEPAQHDYYYFVAVGGGRHRFSHSLEEHLEATEAAQAP